MEKKKKKDDEWAEHVQLDIAGELSAVFISWKGRVKELVELM